MATNLLLTNIQTQRLQFRKLTENDFEAWLPFFQSKEATAYSGFDITKAEENCKLWLENIFKRYQDNNGLMALEDKETGVLIGQCGLLKQRVDEVDEIEIGYHILPQYWQKGYAVEAAIKCKEEGFKMGISSIISIIHPDNYKSIKVDEHNGMVFEKETIFREHKVKIYRVKNKH
ncbi:MAG: GNAT family N-acetyltransferase [bacterium]